MQLVDRVKSLKSPLISSYINSLLGIGFDSKRELMLVKILVISTLLLSLASGYTTYSGLLQYVPSIIAFLVTVAIQGLLFTTSWRIGTVMSSDTFKVSFLIIYLITMLTSVFFSYSALLDHIYTPENRKKEELDRAISQSTFMINKIMINRQKYLTDLSDSITVLLKEYDAIVSKSFSKGLLQVKSEYNSNNKVYQNLIDRYTKEKKYGGTIIRIDGGTVKSPPGNGSIAKRYDSEMKNYYNNSVHHLEESLNNYSYLENRYNDLFNYLVESYQNFTKKNFRKLVATKNEVFNQFNISENIEIINNLERIISKKINENDKYLLFLEQYKQSNQIHYSKSLMELKKSVSGILALIPIMSMPNEIEEAQFAVSKLGSWSGNDIHYFVLSIGELLILNPLAIGTFLIALIIDLLILFCGLMGARPNSYLDMNKSEDLYDIKELALETILSLDLNSENDSYSTDPFINRIIEILKHCKPDFKYAQEEGIPATLSFDDIVELNMQKEIGVLLSLELAYELPDNRLGLRTKLILWLADQVINYSEAYKTNKNFIKSI